MINIPKFRIGYKNTTIGTCYYMSINCSEGDLVDGVLPLLPTYLSKESNKKLILSPEDAKKTDTGYAWENLRIMDSSFDEYFKSLINTTVSMTFISSTLRCTVDSKVYIQSTEIKNGSGTASIPSTDWTPGGYTFGVLYPETIFYEEFQDIHQVAYQTLNIPTQISTSQTEINTDGDSVIVYDVIDTDSNTGVTEGTIKVNILDEQAKTIITGYDLTKKVGQSGSVDYNVNTSTGDAVESGQVKVDVDNETLTTSVTPEGIHRASSDGSTFNNWTSNLLSPSGVLGSADGDKIISGQSAINIWNGFTLLNNSNIELKLITKTLDNFEFGIYDSTNKTTKYKLQYDKDKEGLCYYVDNVYKDKLTIDLTKETTVKFAILNNVMTVDIIDSTTTSYRIPMGSYIGVTGNFYMESTDTINNLSINSIRGNTNISLTNLATSNVVGGVNSDISISATATDYLFRPINNLMLIFTSNDGITKQVNTNENGIASFVDSSTTAVSRTWTVTTQGDSTHDPSESTFTETISVALLVLKADNITLPIGSSVASRVFAYDKDNTQLSMPISIYKNNDKKTTGATISTTDSATATSYSFAPEFWDNDLNTHGAFYGKSTELLAVFEGDTNYSRTQIPFIVSYPKAQLNVTVNVNSTANMGQTSTFHISAITPMGNVPYVPAKVYIDNELVSTVTLNNGDVTVDYTFMTGGDHDVRIVIDESAYYLSYDTTRTISINKTKPQIQSTTTTNSVGVGNNLTLTGKLYANINGEEVVLANKTVYCTASFISYSSNATTTVATNYAMTTNTDGIFTYNYTSQEAGNLSVTYLFNGDNDYDTATSQDGGSFNNKVATIRAVSPRYIEPCQVVSLYGYATDPDSNPITGITVEVSDILGVIGSTITDSTGKCSMDYEVPQNLYGGANVFYFKFKGNATFSPATGTCGSAINRSGVNISTSDIQCKIGNTANISATLTDCKNKSINNETVTINVEKV